MLQLVVVLQGLPSRVSWAQALELERSLIGPSMTALVALGPIWASARGGYCQWV